MNAKVIVTAMLLVLIQGVRAQNFDFRSINWGMDSTKVKSSENSNLLQAKSNSLLYNGKLGDLNAEIVYNFTSTNKVFNAYYLVDFNKKNPQTAVNSFITMRDLLNQKYGKAYKVNISTINGKAITQDEWASNLISDNLNMQISWKNDKTNIMLSLYCLNDELFIDVNYTSLILNNKDEKKELLKKDL